MGADRDAALRLGIGTIDEVGIAVANLPVGYHSTSQDLLRLSGLLCDLVKGDEGRRGVLALLCACLNEKMQETGKLWQIDSDCMLDSTYFVAGEGRDAVAMLIGVYSDDNKGAIV